MFNYTDDYYLKKLEDSGASCLIFLDEDIIFKSDERGVKPLIDFLKDSEPSKEYIIVDKVIGKGAVFLALNIGAVKVITPLASKLALDLAGYYCLEISAVKVVDKIRSRDGKGYCPIEEAVEGINDINRGIAKIRETIEHLMKDNH